MTEVLLFCPPEGTVPALNGRAKFQGVPAVADVIECPSLSPPAGPGASQRHYVVTARKWVEGGQALLVVRHVEVP